MPEAYDLTPDTWPMIAAAAASAVVAICAWRRRVLPAAVPLAVLAAVTFMWAAASALEVAAVETAGKVFWHKAERLCQLIAGSGTLWFALDYANLRRWLTRWTIAVLAAVPVAFALLIVTNDRHALIWTGFSFNGNDVRPLFGVGKWLFIDYEMLVGVLAAVVFLWLFAKSPLHRPSAAVCLIGLAATRVMHVLQTVADVSPLGAVDLTAVVASGSVVVYALMLFRFRTRELLPIAYTTVIEQMREGVLILDGAQRVVEMNPAAASILRVPGEATWGLDALRVPMFQGLEEWLGTSEGGSREIRTGAGEEARWYSVSCSPVSVDGRLQGHFVLLQDITDTKRASARLVEQQGALGALRERSLLARELHDNLGQILGFVKMQAQAARDWLARGQPSRADHYIRRVVAAAQDAQTDVREYIEGAAGTAPAGQLRAMLAQYLEHFRAMSGIAVELNAPEDLDGPALAPAFEAQLFRMVQEALTNVRKHAHARQVTVSLAIRDGCAEATVSDDGGGFRPATLKDGDGNGFGLRFMRERAAEVGGTVGIHSTPGLGTEVVIRIPLRSAVS